MPLKARRLLEMPPYPFAELDRLKKLALAEGRTLLDFGVGDPDLPTPAPIVEALCRASRDARHHRYPPYAGRREFREAAAAWCERRHGFAPDPETEVLALIGSKEGLAHLPLALLDPGDLALVTDPGYPVYANAVRLAGGEAVSVPIRAETGWLPDLEAIDPDLARRARLLFLNYPNNPTGACADAAFFERAVAFARRHGILLVHDAAYAEIGYDGHRPPSLLAAPGGREVGIEFHSLSKTFNMTGWRVGFAAGHREAIAALAQLKTSVDSGVFEPIQVAAALGYREGEPWLEEICEVYRRRRDRLVDGLHRLGLPAMKPRASFYVWTPVPAGQSAAGFAARLLERAGVIVTPGPAFGAGGEGFVRFSLTVPDGTIDPALAMIQRALE